MRAVERSADFPEQEAMDSRDSSSTSSSYFIFNEDEIKEKQISQVGVSACGATAALNVLVSLV